MHPVCGGSFFNKCFVPATAFSCKGHMRWHGTPREMSLTAHPCTGFVQMGFAGRDR